MKRMKTFLIYALLIAGLWIFSEIVIFMSINGTYKPTGTKIYINTPQIDIVESKATAVNGVVKGSIKNNTNEIIDNMYLKIDMYSVRDNNLGTKYVKIDNLHPAKSRDFEMWYQFTDVNYVTITTTTEVENIKADELVSQKVTFYFLVSKLILWSALV